jgi:OOP family OmpA-OmpF porin
MRLPVALVISGMLLASLPAAASERGFFVGAGIGQMTTDVDDVWGSSYNFDESDTGFKIFGGYKFFSWLGVEGAFIDGGEPSVKESYAGASEKLSIGVDTIVGAAIFALPIGEKFELFLKPGWAYWDSTTKYHYSSSSIDFKESSDDSGSAFFIGAGAGFYFNENFGARVEYEWFDVAPEWDDDEDEFVDELDANSGFLSASFVYRF